MTRQRIIFSCFLFIGLFLFPVLETAADTQYFSPPPVVSRNRILHLMYRESSGLGNRLKKTISYLRCYHPHHLNLYWPADGWVSARFSDLFLPQWPISITEYNAPELIKNFPYGEALTEYISEYTLIVARADFTGVSPFAIDGMYNKIPENIKQIYRPYFAALHPSPAVQKKIDGIVLPPGTVAVQIRNAPDWEKHSRKNTPVEDFFAVMDSFPADTKFFISAMSAAAAAPFYLRYPERIMELPEKDYGSMIDATADMFLIGRTEQAVYSFGSTFAEVGWWLGGAKADVIIVGSDKDWPEWQKQPLPMLERIPDGS